MAEIHKLFGGTVPGEPDAGLVKELEGMLADARSGVLEAIAYATVRQSGIIGTGWCGVAGTRHHLSTGILVLHGRYATALAGKETPVPKEGA